MAASLGRPVTGKRPINLLRGLLRYRGRWMRHMAHQNGKDGGWNSYYECIDPITSRLVFSVQGRQLEPILLVAVRELAAIDLATVTPKTSRRVGLQKQQTHLAYKNIQIHFIISFSPLNRFA